MPILPEPWQYIIPDDKKQQFDVLRSLMERDDVTGLVCATDAGREGELIFRFVYQMAGCRKPFERLWISSMEDSAIKDGFAHLKPGHDYDPLYQSALCRAKADWLIGINATRLFSVLYHKTLTVGRVQTPTLKMLVDRDAKITDFKKEKYHIVHIAAGGTDAVSSRFSDAAEANTVKAACAGAQAVCASVAREKKTEQPPKLYDLTTLQREANRLFGFTAKQTLDYTAFYQNDFDIDKSIIHRDAASDQAVDKALLWMSRPSGTYCFRERDVFLKGTRQHNTWKFYGEQTRDKILAYAVELTGTQGGTIRGNLYELDYQQHFRHVVEASQPVSVNRLFYEHGTRDIPDGQYFDGSPDRVLGNFLRYEAQPHDPAVLQEALRQEQHSRGRAVPGDFKAHVTALHDSRIETEARRIVDKLKDLSAPNSPNKTHFMVEISPHFDALASTKDNDRLFAMLPYKSLCFTSIKDRHGVYAMINKDERRDVSIRKPRPSIRKQLADSKQATSPKKAAARTKKNELEV